MHYRSASLGTRVRGYDGGYAERGKCHRASGTSCVLAALVPPLNLPFKGEGMGRFAKGRGIGRTYALPPQGLVEVEVGS